MNDEELALVKRARDGESAAFGRLVDLYRGRVYALATSIVGDHDLSVELTRETFVKAWKALPDLTRPERFPSWLARIAYRAGQGRRSPGTPPRAAGSREGERETLDLALASLPEPQRVAIDLRFRERLGYDEIAETLDVPVAQVRTLLARATSALRQDLAPFLARRLGGRSR